MALLPLVVVVVVAASGLWVYSDASRRREVGDPVVVTIGSFHLETPEVWCLACIVGWIVFFPLYLTARGGR